MTDRERDQVVWTILGVATLGLLLPFAALLSSCTVTPKPVDPPKAGAVAPNGAGIVAERPDHSLLVTRDVIDNYDRLAKRYGKDCQPFPAKPGEGYSEQYEPYSAPGDFTPAPNGVGGQVLAVLRIRPTGLWVLDPQHASDYLFMHRLEESGIAP